MAHRHHALASPDASPPPRDRIALAAAHLRNYGHVVARRIVVGALADACTKAELARTWSAIDRHPELARAVADLRSDRP